MSAFKLARAKRKAKVPAGYIVLTYALYKLFKDSSGLDTFEGWWKIVVLVAGGYVTIIGSAEWLEAHLNRSRRAKLKLRPDQSLPDENAEDTIIKWGAILSGFLNFFVILLCVALVAGRLSGTGQPCECPPSGINPVAGCETACSGAGPAEKSSIKTK